MVIKEGSSIEKNVKPQVLYIVGRGHSGSTLLELLLNRNPQAASMGEVNLLGLQLYRTGEHSHWTGECSCRNRPFECPIWGETLTKLQRDYQLDLTKKPLAFRISDEGMAEEYGWKKPLHVVGFKLTRLARIISHKEWPLISNLFSLIFQKWSTRRDAVYRAYSEVQQAGTVVDASKDYLQMLDLYKYSSLPVKFLYITRDVRGHASSSIRKKRATAELEAKNWTKLNKTITKTLEQIPPENWMHVKYEELCAETNRTLSKIFRFANLPDQQLSPDEEKRHRHTIAGNHTRFRDLKVIIHDQKWKGDLSDSEIKTIRKHSETMSKTLGYQ